jgi:hypothetical protein
VEEVPALLPVALVVRLVAVEVRVEHLRFFGDHLVLMEAILDWERGRRS